MKNIVLRVKSLQVLKHRASGQAMVETVIIMMVLMLMVLGIIQFALVYNTKTTLNYATFEATRAGALNHANSLAITYAFAGALAPIYTSIDASDGMFDSVNEVKNARNRVFGEIDVNNFGQTGSACFEQLNPTRAAFNAHQIVDDSGRDVIPNDHLKYRTSDDGGSNVSIQDANLLKLKVTYCYPLYVPLISTVIKRTMGVEIDPDPLPGWVPPRLGNFNRQCYTNGGMPIVAQAIVRMQTPVHRLNTFMGNTCN